MKNILLFAATLLAFSANVRAQSAEETRRYLLEKLIFYYVDNLATPKPAVAQLDALAIDKVAISNNQDIASPVWTNANNVGLKNLLIKLLRPENQGGDVNMQRLVRNVLLITDKEVYVYLYGDFPNVVPDTSWSVYCTTTGYEAAHSNASWPCARCFTNRTRRASGEIGIGAYFFLPTRPDASGGWSTEADKGTVFIHELVHTQLPLVLEPTLTGSMYGLGGHSFWEMIPSRNSAFNEGIANAFGFKYNFSANLQMTSWFNNNSSLFADNIPGCPTGTTKAQCLQIRLANASVTPLATCWHADAACYNIRDIPGPIILYNENVTSNILYQYMQQFRSETMLVRDIKRAAADMAIATNYTFAPLFKEIVKSGMNYTNPNRPAGTSTHGQHLPLGILDYYTGYKLDSKAALESMLGVTWDATYPNIDEYFTLRRRVLLGFRENNTTWAVSQLSRFAENLNVRTPQQRAAAPDGGGAGN